MTKKDFELIARTIRDLALFDQNLRYVAVRFADALEAHPTRTPFVRERFLAIALGENTR